MTNQFPDDKEVHARALAYASRHAVSYSEAVSAVAFAAREDAPQVSTSAKGSESAKPSRSDAEVDRAAKAYMRRHGSTYAAALEAVLAGDDADASFAESAEGVRALAGQPIEIFKAGSHIDSQGTARTFTLADIQGIAQGYSPSRHEAPLTLGHPQDNRPAYGWVRGLEAAPDGRLLMRADQLDPEFERNVRAGRYKKRSASFYPPHDPSNPTPGRWYLRHVAWLGAQAPAIKGLADVQFGALGDCVTFDL